MNKHLGRKDLKLLPSATTSVSSLTQCMQHQVIRHELIDLGNSGLVSLCRRFGDY